LRQARAPIGAIRVGDEAAVETTVVELSRSRRILAPLFFGIGAFAMLFRGMRLLVVNWRLTLTQILPAPRKTIDLVDRVCELGTPC
jgi:hypothetical protein